MTLLLMKYGSGSQVGIALHQREYIIGRSESCDICVADDAVSRKHAVLRQSGESWVVEDLGSKNPTQVNRAPILKQSLRADDIFTIGAVEFRLLTAYRPAPTQKVFDKNRVTRIMTGDLLAKGDQNRLALLLEIAAALDSVGSAQELLERCGHLVMHIFEPACCLLEVGQNSWCNRYDDLVTSPDKLTDISHTVIAEAKKGEAVLHSDVTKTPNISRANSICSLGICSAIAAPILFANEVAGYIYVDQKNVSRFFEEEDLHYLIGLSRLLSSAFANAERWSRLDAENRLLRNKQSAVGKIVGNSPVIEKLRQDIKQRIARASASVLLMGETGTGKSLVAEAIHLESPRRQQSLVEVNCAAIPANLIESELFGYNKGAFSGADSNKPGLFEMANGGTLFLDEIAELAVEAQAKLLTVIQNRRLQRLGSTTPVEVDVRIIAATNRDLKKEVEAGRFRADLFYRLNVVTLTVPPLRKRPEDLQLLADHFLRGASKQLGRRIQGIRPDVMELLERYGWPGNARELANCVERAVIFAADGGYIEVEHLPQEILDQQPEESGLGPVAQKERELIVDALQQAGGNKREAARLLCWYPQKLYSRIKKYGI